MTIYYLAPDSNRPSWGVGILYYHVRILCALNYSACILHDKSDFKLTWLNLNVPVKYREHLPPLTEEDILVVPEVMVNMPGLRHLKCKKILFVQATAFLFESLPSGVSHIDLGFTLAIGIMPHMTGIIERHTGLTTQLIPPFIAKAFFKTPSKIHVRKKNILIFPKFNLQDYGIVVRLVTDKLKQINPGGFISIINRGWQLIEVRNKTHKQVASLMQDATYFISLNSFEAFNTSVPEAMAAGCINFCYEGFGPKDYIKHKSNAFVFGNNEAYALCDNLFSALENHAENLDEMKDIRENAVITASNYSMEHTKEKIEIFYKWFCK